MKANELLEKQHRLVEDLFERFESAEGREKVQLFDEIAKNLVAHDAIERELFYPACEEALGQKDDILGESLVEHGLVEFSIFRADKNRNGEDLEKYVTVLKEVVEHHVKEEESELLPKVKRNIDKQRLESLGAEMEARFEEALQEDFRGPLTDSLQQVLAGRTKTQKRSAGARAKVSSRVKKARASRAERPAARSAARKGGKRQGAKARNGRTRRST